MSIAPLVSILDQLHDCHVALLELAKEKTPVLVHNQVDALNQIVQKESKWVRDIAALDQQRVYAIGEYLIKRGYSPNANVTIGDLVRIVFKAEEKQILTESHTRLLAVLEQVQRVNQLNQELIRQSLSFIDYSLDLLVGAPEDDVLYRPPSVQKTNSSRIGVFDTKA